MKADLIIPTYRPDDTFWSAPAKTAGADLCRS